MKRYLVYFLAALLLCLCVAVSVQAAPPLLVDGANLLTETEEEALLTRLNELRRTYQMDVVIVTTKTLQGKSPQDYADDFYDDGGYSTDGILLLVSMAKRDYCISTCGYGITVVTEKGLDYLEDRFVPPLSDDNYNRAFTRFIDGCDYLISQAKAGRVYNKAPVQISFMTVLVYVGIGAIVAFIVTGSMKRKLKSVVRQTGANGYIRSGSLQLSQQQDTFLYRNVTRVARPKDGGGSHGGGTRTHVSSAGRVHGGRSGKF